MSRARTALAQLAMGCPLEYNSVTLVAWLPGQDCSSSALLFIFIHSCLLLRADDQDTQSAQLCPADRYKVIFSVGGFQ